MCNLFLDDAAVEKMAAAIHEIWRALGKENGWLMQPRFNRPYAELEEFDKEDAQAAARRMPEVLRLVGLTLRPSGEEETALSHEDPKALFLVLDQNMDRLANAEHDGWMAYRAKNGWRYGRRCA